MEEKMRSQFRQPFLFFFGLLAIVSLACGIDFGNHTSLPPTQPPPVVSTPLPPPTEVIQQPPTEVSQPSNTAEQFYTENFDSQNDNWSYFTIKGDTSTDESGLTLKTAGGYLTFDITSRYLYTYVTYDPFTYQDVRVDARVENRGVNNNNISLFCRYSDEGWYEFNIANNGLYNIYAATYNASHQVVYNKITDGGSNKIKQGKDINEYAIICKGRKLTLFINGFETKSVDENKFVLRDGKVGISVSSFNVTPVKVDVDWIKISQP